MILGIYGLQDAGKTTLVEELIASLVNRGYRVSSIKHSSRAKSIDTEGKDTWRHWKAGSDPVVFSSETETALIKHTRMDSEDIARIVAKEFRPDIIIVEGFKGGNFPKVALGDLRPRKGTVLVNPSLKELVKYAETEIGVERVRKALPLLDCGKCGKDCEGLARDIFAGKRALSACQELAESEVEVRIGDEPLRLGRYATAVVEGTVRGLLSTLKGYEPGSEVVVRLGMRKTPAIRDSGKRPKNRSTH